MNETVVTLEPRCFRCTHYKPWAEPADLSKGRCGLLDIYTRANSGEGCRHFQATRAAFEQAVEREAVKSPTMTDKQADAVLEKVFPPPKPKRTKKKTVKKKRIR